jgi:predicted N-acetyltransferase YhbS
MTIELRPIEKADVPTCGQICYDAFKSIADKHNFRQDFPNPEMATQFLDSIVGIPGCFGVVAELDGKVVGSNFLAEYDEIRAVGPITVDPEVQAKGVGRKLMEAVIERGKGSRGVRLVQDAFNSASMSLYASLGFEVREPLVLIEGDVAGPTIDNFEVRVMTENDLDACEALCRTAHGFGRTNELRHTPPFLPSFVALRNGKIVAYASAPHFWAVNHAVAESVADMTALLTGISNISNGQPLSLLLPTRQAELFRWCLSNGMKVMKPLTLMTTGEYIEPRLCYLPSVGY